MEPVKVIYISAVRAALGQETAPSTVYAYLVTLIGSGVAPLAGLAAP